MRNAESAKIKDVILQGVYEDNLAMAALHAKPGRLGQKPGYRFITRILSVLLLTMVIVLIQFVADPINQQSTNPVAFSEMASILPWAEIVHDQRMASFTVQQPSYLADSTPWPVTPFNAQRLLEYNLLLNHDQVRLSSVFGLDVQTIVIDPGHGGRDPGAIGSQGTREKDIVLDIALRLRDQLMQSGQYIVLLTRDTDTFMSLADRVRFSNLNKADLFISLHINALPQNQFNVTETFYFGPPSDLYTLRLAEQENRGSELLTGDFKNMIKKIGDVLKEQESATLAATIQHSLFSNMEKYDRVIADNGTKIAPFVVLLGVDAPSVLVEISCISKSEEETNLNNPAYREKITSSLEEGISRYLTQRHTQVVKGDDNGKKISTNNS
ncbi:MAG: N-acetylmuramoyl-L-alanine amidase [Deltaproteobacteria bacterium]|nr:N-acetylmuramoyl-L-alanine amidase [Deltaproteobacteria bacterium]